MGNRASFGTTFSTSVWSERAVDWIRVAAITGLVLDAVTTWHVLASDDYIEFNPFLDVLWTVHPLLIVAYFGGFGLVVTAIFTRRLGWLSTATSAYVIVVMGVFGGLNNLELLVFGSPGLVDLLATTMGMSGAILVQSVIPACGLFVAVGAARFRHGALPWNEVVVAAVGATVVYLLSCRGVGHLLGVVCL